MKSIGFVGLGAMGSVMAPLLNKSGYVVYGYDIRSISNDKNIKLVKNLYELCDKDIIIFMLPNGSIVNSVVK